MLRELIRLLFKRSEAMKPIVAHQRKPTWDNEKIEAKVKELVAGVLGVSIDEVRTTSNIYRLGSSNDVTEVLMCCEEEFNIEIPDEDTEQCETVGSLTTYIGKKLFQ